MARLTSPNEITPMGQDKTEIRESLEQAMSTLVISPTTVRLTRNILAALKECRTVEQFEAIAMFASRIAGLSAANSQQEIKERSAEITQEVLKTLE